MVTVALDTGGAEAVRQWIERAQPEHPSLIDQAHVIDELLGVVNVPNGVWIDEEGVIVRPAEPAFAKRRPPRDPPPDLPPELAAMFEEASKIRAEPEKYVAALRDWVDNGSDSPYALSPDEVVERSRPRGREVAEAAAHFELAQHLHRTGRADAAVPHFREAHRLDPENWTYRRQAWVFAHPFQLDDTAVYDDNWLSAVRKVGAENYYPALEM